MRELPPLYLASQNGHLSVVKCLANAGADVNIMAENTGMTPLFCASHDRSSRT